MSTQSHRQALTDWQRIMIERIKRWWKFRRTVRIGRRWLANITDRRKTLEHVHVSRYEIGKWFVCSRLATKEFPHCGYLRADGQWAYDMRYPHKEEWLYFKTEEEARNELEKWL